MGTTTQAIILLGIVAFIAPLVWHFFTKGFASMKNHFREDLLGGALIVFAIWVTAYGWNLIKTVYQDHDQLVVRVAATQHQTLLDRNQCKTETDALQKKYASQIDGLQRKLADSNAALTQARQAQPTAYIGFPKTKLMHSISRISVDTTLHNYGTVSAENISTVGSVVLGEGADSQMLSTTLSPPVRLLPGEEHDLDIYIEAKKGMEYKGDFKNYVSLIRRRQPMILTVNLYFVSGGVRYSQHTELSYDYKEQFWHRIAEQSLQGFVAMPAAIYKGIPQYWTAPWLPPIPPALGGGAGRTIEARPVF